MYCKKCGSKIDDDSIFCAVCGTRVVNDIESENNEMVYEESGNGKSSEQKPIESVTNGSENISDGTKSNINGNKKKYIILAIVVIAVIGALIGGVIYFLPRLQSPEDVILGRWEFWGIEGDDAINIENNAQFNTLMGGYIEFDDDEYTIDVNMCGDVTTISGNWSVDSTDSGSNVYLVESSVDSQYLVIEKNDLNTLYFGTSNNTIDGSGALIFKREGVVDIDSLETVSMEDAFASLDIDYKINNFLQGKWVNEIDSSNQIYFEVKSADDIYRLLYNPSTIESFLNDIKGEKISPNNIISKGSNGFSIEDNSVFDDYTREYMFDYSEVTNGDINDIILYERSYYKGIYLFTTKYVRP